MTKETILAEIVRTAQLNGGKPLGSHKFESETGIKSTLWLGKIWARWSDALQEAGFIPNVLVKAHDKEFLFETYAKLSSANNRLVTKSDMRLMSRNGVEVPDWNTFQNRFGSKVKFIDELAIYLRQVNRFADVIQMCADYGGNDSEKYLSVDNEIISVNPSIEFVYLLKSGKFYKAGRTNSVGRRQYEIAKQMPEEVVEIHRISTDDSPGIERYWHQRFANKRKNGEWFDLSKEDVAAFKLRKFM